MFYHISNGKINNGIKLIPIGSLGISGASAFFDFSNWMNDVNSIFTSSNVAISNVDQSTTSDSLWDYNWTNDLWDNFGESLGSIPTWNFNYDAYYSYYDYEFDQNKVDNLFGAIDDYDLFDIDQWLTDFYDDYQENSTGGGIVPGTDLIPKDVKCLTKLTDRPELEIPSIHPSILISIRMDF